MYTEFGLEVQGGWKGGGGVLGTVMNSRLPYPQNAVNVKPALNGGFGRLVSDEAAKARERPPQSPRGITALARLGFFARPTKSAMIRKLENGRPHSSDCRKFNPIIINQVMKM